MTILCDILDGLFYRTTMIPTFLAVPVVLRSGSYLPLLLILDWLDVLLPSPHFPKFLYDNA